MMFSRKRSNHSNGSIESCSELWTGLNSKRRLQSGQRNPIPMEESHFHCRKRVFRLNTSSGQGQSSLPAPLNSREAMQMRLPTPKMQRLTLIHFYCPMPARAAPRTETPVQSATRLKDFFSSFDHSNRHLTSLNSLRRRLPWRLATGRAV
jgi:hypothetical protein